MSKNGAALERMFGALGGIESMGGENARDYAPHVPLFICREILPRLGLDDARHLPDTIVTSCTGIYIQLFVAVQGNHVHV